MKKVTCNLTEQSPSIFLNAPHSKLIFNYAKRTIVLSKLFKQSMGKVYYVIQENNCYGAILIKSAKPISLEEFTKTRVEHRITEKERELWWKDKKVLFTYFFDIVQNFDKPKVIKELKNRNFGGNVEFLSEEKPKKLLEKIEPTSKIVKSFLNKEEAIGHINEGKFAIEKMFGGSRILIYKNEEDIKFYSFEEKEWIKLDSFKEEADKLSDKNFVVDGEFISQGKQKIYLYDILRLGDDIRKLGWNDRISKLHSLKFSDKIIETPSIIINNKFEGEEAIKFLGGLPGSIGVMIKPYESKYLQDWCKLEN